MADELKGMSRAAIEGIKTLRSDAEAYFSLKDDALLPKKDVLEALAQSLANAAA